MTQKFKTGDKVRYWFGGPHIGIVVEADEQGCLWPGRIAIRWHDNTDVFYYKPNQLCLLEEGVR